MKKNISRFFLTLTIALLIPAMYLTFGENRPVEKMEWGASFSKRAAEPFGLDWKEVYLAILDDLKVNRLRISSFWSETEPAAGQFDFGEMDFMLAEAAKRDVKIILTLGRRQPRWPESHIPDWAKNLNLEEQNTAALNQVREVVERYKSYANIVGWQVENEFFVTWFGICPPPDAEFLKKEIALVRSLDNRPIILTDTGELSVWYRAAKYADVFGTTMYRRAFNPIFGVADWPYPPVYYSRLGKLVQRFAGFKKMIVAELQAEPWARTTVQNDTIEVNFETMSPEQFKSNIEFARNSGIGEAYFWGVEWWYYMKEKRGIPDFWETARGLWQPEN